MKPLNPFVVVLTAIFAGVMGHASAQTPSPIPESDTQNWNDFQLTVPLSKTADFLVVGTLRIGGNLTKAVDGRWGFGFNYKAGKYLSFSQILVQREAKPPNGRREHEQRLTLAGTVRFPVGKFTLSDRNSVERRWRQPQADSWRYRNAVLIEHPFKIGKKQFTLGVGDEIFYDWSLHGWVRNRFAVGVSHAFNKHFTLYVYGMRQNDGRARPGDINVIGTQMRFRL